jgi:hypothetical protein
MPSPVPTLITGILPNKHGVYDCPPDRTLTWRQGKDFVEVKLLWLADQRIVFVVDDYLKNGGDTHPLYASNARDGDVHADIMSTIVDCLNMAAARKIPAASLKSLKAWVAQLNDDDGWLDEPDADVPVPAPEPSAPVRTYDIPAARTGEMPNGHGAYTCDPDATMHWERGNEWAVAKVLRLANGRYAWGVDYQFRDGGRRGPIFVQAEGDSYREMMHGLKKAALHVADQGKDRGMKGAALASLMEWAEGIDSDGWVNEPEAGVFIAPAPNLPAPISPLDEEVNAVIEAATAMDVATRDMAARLNYQLPADSTNPDLICRDIVANIRRSVEGVLEIGRGLLVLKQACAHGSFIGRVEALGLDRKVAAKFMQAAVKFSNDAISRHLLPKIDSVSKLFEFLTLDDEQIDELTETGQTGELKLDDVACMSVSELRKSLREIRNKAAAKDAVIEGNQKTISNLQEQLVSQKSDTDPAETPVIDPAVEALANLEAAQNKLSLAVLDLQSRLSFVRDAVGDGPRLLSIQHAAFEQALGVIRQAAQELDVPLKISGEDMPLTDTEATRQWFEEYNQSREAEEDDGESICAE